MPATWPYRPGANASASIARLSTARQAMSHQSGIRPLSADEHVFDGAGPSQDAAVAEVAEVRDHREAPEVGKEPPR